MNIRMGSQIFRDVQIPLLWGERAIIQDEQGRLSIIDLSGEQARLEILADEPAPGVVFRPRIDGIVVINNGVELYSFNPREKLVSSIGLGLPDCQVGSTSIVVGSNQFSGNFISGFGVGIAVTNNGISIGAPIPHGLAKLVL